MLSLFNNCNWSTENSKYIYHENKFINVERAVKKIKKTFFIHAIFFFFLYSQNLQIFSGKIKE